MAETAAEKVLSLLRRCAYKWDGHQTKGDIGPALVRHVYDVARIAELSAGALSAARDIFPTLVVSERDEFKGQNPEFDVDPVGVLRRTLTVAKSHGELQDRYACGELVRRCRPLCEPPRVLRRLFSLRG